EIKVVADNRVEGYTRVRGGWNKGEAYAVYFSAIFEQPFSDFGIWKDSVIIDSIDVAFDEGLSTGAYLLFPEELNTVQVKVGISFLSNGKAYQNIQEEIPHWDFETTLWEAENSWSSLLDNIKVSTDIDSLKTIFYTGLYHALLMPADRTGENPKWQSDQPYYDDFYAIWDTYRATHPLYLLLAPDRQKDILNALIDIYSVEGYMPDARSGNASGRTQGGSNSDVLIADAFTKGLTGINYEKALESMLKNAEVPPGYAHQMKGRGGLLDYNQLGYVSTNHERAGSRTVEYAYNDYCIYLVAKGLGKDSIAAKYFARSNNWKNLWKPVSDSGAKGFIMPRNASGEWDESYLGRAWQSEKGWQPVDFSVHVSGTWPDFFYEADSWEYSFYVPHDLPSLIDACGGRQAFEKRLDTFFAEDYYNVSNEPSFLTPSLYNYLGRQDKTLTCVRQIIADRYNTTAAGIPGNDDSGSMSAWVAFHLMGFYPVAGQDLYLITAPHFKEVTIDMGSQTPFTVITHNLSEKNIYLQKVHLNGQELRQSWFRHTDIKPGGKLEFFIGDQPTNDWEVLLPSQSSE
ncbi:MAG: GH92 family glycosyl hydrolase, partial [Bacteroidota bacterium]